MANRNVLLDADVIIGAYDDGANRSDESRKLAKSLIRSTLEDQNTTLCITQLIRYEVLRGAGWSESGRLATLVSSLDSLTVLEITKGVCDLAAKIFRFDTEKSKADGIARNVDKLRFDAFHFATAKIHSIDLVTLNKKDFDRLESLFQEMQST